MGYLETPTRRGLLASAVAIALFGASMAAQARSLNVATPPHWKAGDGSGVAAIFDALRAAPPRKRAAGTVAVTTPVTSCADDGTSGTLRSVVTGAGEGDTVDLRGLSCGAITLTHGVIPVYVDTLTLIGDGPVKTVIDGNASDRVFLQYGQYALNLRYLTVRNGFNQVGGYNVAGGACILSNAYVTLDHAAVQDCTAIGEGAYGGGILAPGLTMYTSTLSGNTARGSLLTTLTASYGGGAFAYRGTVVLYDSTVSGNNALGDPANSSGTYDTGAGIFTDNGGYILRSTLNDNYTDGTGGGIATHGPLIVANSTISGNVATKKAGGGVFAKDVELSIVSSTIAQNAAARGGGVYGGGIPGFGFGIILQSSIVADNFVSSGFADIDARSAEMISGSNNLVVDAQDSLLPPDTLRSDPKLLPLGFNGGPTQTHAIAPTSPARDAGANPASLATDQRGGMYTRVYGPAADIGAFEFTLPDQIFNNGFD